LDCIPSWSAKKLCGEAELLAGRGEKGGLLVLLIDDGMIARMALARAQLRYNRVVICFTFCLVKGEANRLD
jgi:hypothetical protein